MRHGTVGQQKIEGLRGGTQPVQHCASIVEGLHPVADLGEHGTDDLADHFFVIHDQDAFPAARENIGIGLSDGDVGLDGLGKVEFEGGAQPRLAMHGNRAVVVLHDAVHDGQAEPGSLAGPLGGKKGFENARQHIGTHTAARVR